MELVKYRDAGMNTHTYFWVNDQGQAISPFFDSEDRAQEWLTLYLIEQKPQQNSK
jgi:hypothetical protein